MKGKRKSQAKGKEVDLIEQSKAIYERPERFSAAVAKIQMDDLSSDEKESEESDNDDTDLTSKSENSDSDFY